MLTPKDGASSRVADDSPFANLGQEFDACWDPSHTRLLSFGSPGAEARGASESCAVALGDRRRIDLRGSDRLRYLQGQVTCDVEALVAGSAAPGAGTYGFFTTTKGRIEADVMVAARSEDLLLSVPPGTAESLAERLEKYVIIDDVEVAPRPTAASLLVCGPQSAHILRELAVTPFQTPAHAWGWARIDLGIGNPGDPDGASAVTSTSTPGADADRQPLTATLLRRADLGLEGYELWFDNETQASEAFQRLCRGGAHPAGFEALEALRLVAGEPRFEADFGPDSFPQETGREEAVSYTKGCYLGQEVVARLHYRGQVARRITPLQLVDLPSGEGPAPGTALLHDQRPAGHLTSVTRYSPPNFARSARRGLALGLVQRRAFDTGTELDLEGGGRAIVLPPKDS